MLAFKGGVRLKRLSKALIHIIHGIEHVYVYSLTGVPKVLTITSINDSKHSINSKHYTDKALYLRSKNFSTSADKKKFRRILEIYLNREYEKPRFRVLLESLGKPNEHFHIQVKKGETF